MVLAVPHVAILIVYPMCRLEKLDRSSPLFDFADWN